MINSLRELQALTQEQISKLSDYGQYESSLLLNEAKIKLALCKINGFGTPKSPLEGIDLLFDVVLGGREFSVWTLESLSKHKFLELEEQFFEYYFEKRENKDPRILTIIGICYAFGIGIDKNPSQTFRFYTLAAEQGYAAAQYFLGLCYINGSGTKKDPATAVKYFQLAVEQCDPNGQCALAACYNFGIGGVQSSTEESVLLYKRSAEGGNATAQYTLGVWYERGVSVLADRTEALKWYNEAKQQGSIEAAQALQKL